MGPFDPDRGDDHRRRLLRREQDLSEHLLPLRARALGQALRIALEHLPANEVEPAAHAIADAYVSNVRMSLFDGGWSQRFDSPPPRDIDRILASITDQDIAEWVSAEVLRELREGRIVNSAWSAIAAVAKQQPGWHDYGWTALLRKVAPLERVLIARMLLDQAVDLLRLANETGISLFKLARLYLSATDFLRSADASNYERIAGSPVDVVHYLEIPGIEMVELAVSRVWAQPLVKPWLFSHNSHLDGARPIDVLVIEGPERVFEALDEEMAGAFA